MTRSRKTVGRAAAGLGLLVALGGGGCAASYPTPPAPPPHDGFPLRRFDRVDRDVYRSGQPTAAELRQLVARYGIRTVLKLNHGADAVPPGVTLLHRPLSALRVPEAAALSALLDDLERAEKPVLIHCTHGEDRTGLVVALYRMRRGSSVDVAFTDMVRHGFHPYRGVYGAWQQAVGWAR